MRPRTSPIWNMPRDEFIALVSGTTTGVSGIVNAMGLRRFSYNYKSVRKRIKEEGLDYDALKKQWRNQFVKSVVSGRLKPLDDFMTEHSAYTRQSLKRRLLKEGRLKNECSMCGQKPEWNGIELVMVLDHVNGIHDDCRIDNLRLLCPNCNSQQSTFSGRNNRGVRRTMEKRCADCGSVIGLYSVRCRKCASGKSRRVVRPDMSVLRSDVSELGWEATGRKYGVSGNAVRKWFYELSRSAIG